MTVPEIYQDGVRYVPSKIAARNVGLVPDYISRMCRDGQVRGIRHAGVWYVDEDSLASFLQLQKVEYEAFKKRKADVGREFLQVSQNPRRRLITRPHPILHQFNARLKRRSLRYANFIRGASLATTCLVILLSGALAFELVAPPGSSNRASLVQAITGTQTQIAAASIPILDPIADKVFKIFCPLFRHCPSAPAETRVVYVEIPAKPPAKIVSTPPRTPITQTVINNPIYTEPVERVVERVTETVRTVIEPGVNASYIDERLSLLENSLLSKIEG